MTLTNRLPTYQVHVNQDALLKLAHDGIPTLDCDGLAIIEGPSYEGILECFRDDEYKRFVVPGQARVIDMARIKMIPVDILPYSELCDYPSNGQALPGKAGT